MLWPGPPRSWKSHSFKQVATDTLAPAMIGWLRWRYCSGLPAPKTSAEALSAKPIPARLHRASQFEILSSITLSRIIPSIHATSRPKQNHAANSKGLRSPMYRHRMNSVPARPAATSSWRLPAESAGLQMADDFHPRTLLLNAALVYEKLSADGVARSSPGAVQAVPSRSGLQESILRQAAQQSAQDLRMRPGKLFSPAAWALSSTSTFIHIHKNTHAHM